MLHKVVYKVVRKHGGGRFSSNFVQGKARVRYSTKHYAKAPEWLREMGNDLLAFNTLKQAEDYRMCNCSKLETCIFVAYARGKIRDAAERDVMYRTWSYMELAEGKIDRLKKGGKTQFPVGSLACSEIRLVKEV